MGARLCALLLLLALGSRAGLAAQPNILLIVSDDFGADSSALYPFAGDSGAVPMPNLAKLAAGGLVFENAWVNPMCSPTRATIISGFYGYRTGVLVAGDVLAPETKTIWDYIGKESPAKYHMAVFGKWHLGGNGGDIKHVQSLRVPNFHGFLGAQISDFFKWTAWDGNTGKSSEVTKYSTTALTDWAIEFLRKHAATRPRDPWFLYVPYNAPHAPFQVPPKKLHSQDLDGQKPGTRAATVPVYKAMLQAMDSEIGRLLKRVDLRNTVVIFIGDNGTPANVKDAGSKVRGAKISVWEGGVRVPLVIAGAGITRAGREPALVNGTDLYATIAAIAGIPVQHVNDSHSIVPLFTDARASTGRDYAFTEFCTAQSARFAIRDRRHKLIYDNASGWGLYDLQEDPAEAGNLYDKPASAAVQKKLAAELARLKAAASKGCFL
jgi:arylsulfatase A-like enzyme